MPRKVKENLLDRLNDRTIKIDGGCWLWQGCRVSSGYGQIEIRNIKLLVHRLSAHLHWGFNLNSPMQILHKCDVRNCWNPEHLFEGTAKDNTQDARVKGRHLGWHYRWIVRWANEHERASQTNK